MKIYTFSVQKNYFTKSKSISKNNPINYFIISLSIYLLTLQNIFLLLLLLLILFYYMSGVDLLMPIFLNHREPSSLIMVMLLTNLLNKGIDWKHYQIYVPTRQNQQAAGYKPTLRWNFDDPKHQITRNRFYWALQTLGKLKVDIIFQSDLIKKDKRQQIILRDIVILPQQIDQYMQAAIKHKNYKMPLYSALAFVHYFWCDHQNLDFLGWHIHYVKLYEYWLRLADHINLLFTEVQLEQFSKTIAKKSIFNQLITQAQKQQIRKAYKTEPSQFTDLSLPYWRWNLGKKVGDNFYYEFPSKFFNHLKTVEFGAFYLDALNQRKGIDSGMRYYTFQVDMYKQNYINQTLDSDFLQQKVYKPFLQQRSKIMEDPHFIWKFGNNQTFFNQKIPKAYKFLKNLVNMAIETYQNSKKNQQTYRSATFWIRRAHNVIHQAVEFPLGSIPDAAFHPLFWIHHCNIQRMRQMVLKRFKDQNLSQSIHKQLKQRRMVDSHVANQQPILGKDNPYMPFVNGNVNQQNYLKRFITAQNSTQFRQNWEYRVEQLKQNFIDDEVLYS